MPSLFYPPIPHYRPAPMTAEALEYAELPIIDLSKATTLEGRLELAVHVRQAMVDHGFFYAINHGYSKEQMDRVLDIADVPFTQVSNEEKEKYMASSKITGSWQGYKPRQYWHIANGVHDQIENYNMNRDVYKRQHPEALRPLLSELQEFTQHTHMNVVHKILRILALGLEVPEETFVDMHTWSNDRVHGETFLRFMKYYPRSEEDEEKSGQVWMKGHTDFGTVTVLYSQPVAALQILTQDRSWKWLKHIENALIINAGDSMEFLSGGLYRATIHRVIQPPKDQRQYSRLGIFYFSLADDDVKLAPLTESPILQRVGIKRRFEDSKAPTSAEWRKARTAAYGQSDLKESETEKGVEQEVILDGVVVKHYK
ncbi:hypothetical protein J3R30DRAFT_3713143 [Lentinula aciculospora]|uniref:Clavaminate synthase-like protein n=1 Tax=Lentinula aciculospora TaxID=153920 RepID=A0A9W9DHS6_9AGAR|nr:hypothetical protein J3R30DRAFT_3713143 [Lentinula aciculospora]